MSAWHRVTTVGETQGRDLLRRRLAMVMLLLLPALFYLSVVGEESEIGPTEEPWTLSVGVIGVAWTIAGGAFFLGLSSRRVDERLTLVSYRPSELAAGRLLFLAALAAVVVAIYSSLLTVLSDADSGPLVLAVASTGVVAIALGLALAALLPRELEGTLALIAVVGLQASLPHDLALGVALPFHGATQLVGVAWASSGAVLPHLLHTAAATGALLLVFLVLWSRRLAL